MCKKMPDVESWMPITSLFSQGYLNMVARYLKIKGHNYAEFLNTVDLTNNEWNQRSFSLSEILNFLNKAIEFSKDKNLPVLAGRHINLTNFSTLGTLVLHCANIEAVINNVIHFHNLTNNGEFDLSVVHENEKVYLRFSKTSQYSDEQISPLIEIAMAVFANVSLFLASGASVKDLGSAQINFCHKQVNEIESYINAFRIPVKFDQKFNQIVFSDSFLKIPVCNANKELYVLTKQHLEKQLSLLTLKTSEEDKVEALLIGMDQPQTVKLKFIAEKLDISVSSLQRKLAEQGTSYKDIKDSIILKLSNRLLQNTQTPIIDIAIELGFSDTNSFSRTYKRLNDKSPNEFRADVHH